jgi:predicted small integral membrane protein
MKWTWFNMDEPAVGFILGIALILIGLWAINEYVNVAVGQRGAAILLFVAGISLFGGVTNNVYITIQWLRMSGGKKEVKQMRNNE